MLSPSSLNLDSYFYSRINVSLDLQTYFSEETKQITANDLTAHFSVNEDLEDTDNLIITLEVITDKSNTQVPLDIEIRVLGRFLAAAELREKLDSRKVTHEQLISTGLAILYGGIRDQVLSLTAKMPIGPVFLPTCTFNVTKNVDQDQDSSEEIQKPLKTTKTSRSNKKTT